MVGKNKHIAIIIAFAIISNVPIPECLNFVCDGHGATLSDRVWFFSMYAMLTTALHLCYKLNNELAFKVVYLLSVGKLIDQVYNPYGFHLAEYLWITLILTWTIAKLCRKKMQAYGQKS